MEGPHPSPFPSRPPNLRHRGTAVVPTGHRVPGIWQPTVVVTSSGLSSHVMSSNPPSPMISRAWYCFDACYYFVHDILLCVI